MLKHGNHPKPGSEEVVKDTFRKLMSRTDAKSVLVLDPMSESIGEVVLELLPKAHGTKVLEAGSGTGKISAVLASCGYEVILLDISREDLDLSRRVFRAKKCRFLGLQGSLFSLPVRNGYFDAVWNAVVLEHYHFDEQVEALLEISRVMKLDGLLVTLNPSASGLIYRLAKFLLERLRKWPFGQEFPVKTLRPQCAKAGLKIEFERDVFPEHQFLFFHRYGAPLFNACRRWPILRRSVYRVFGGYLKLSVITKATAPSEGYH